MAGTVTVAVALNGANTGDTSNVSTYTSASFTPVAGDLLVIMCDVSGSATITATASANGITFTNRIAHLAGTSANQGAILTANQLVGASPSAMTVTMAVAGGNGTGGDVCVARVAGLTKSGATAVRQVAKTDNTAAGTTPNVVFPGVCLTGNVVLVGLSNATNPATLTPPTSFTEGGDTGYATPTHGYEWAYRNSGHTSATVTWGGSSGSQWGASGIELDASVGSAVPIAATLDTTQTTTAALNVTYVGGGTLAVTATETAGLFVTRPADATLAVTATTTATVNTQRPMAATLAVTQATTADIIGLRPTGGTLATTAGITAAIGALRPTATTLATTATLTADLVVVRSIQATLAITAGINTTLHTSGDVTVEASLGGNRWAGATGKRWDAASQTKRWTGG